MLRRIWNFIVQPTQPIQLWPSAAAANAPTNAVAAITEAAASANTPVVAALPSAFPGSNSGLYEAAGLLGAVILCQSVQWALDRYARSSSDAALWKPNDARVRELIEALQLSPHVEGGYYRRIYEAPWILRGSVCIERAAGEDASASSSSSSSSSAAALSPAGSVPTASASLLPMHFPRALSSCIYFLLSASAGPRSHFHRLPHAEELWMHCEGDPLVIAQIDEQSGEYSERILGPVCLQSTEQAAAGRGAHLFVQRSSTAPPTLEQLAAFAPVDALQLYHTTALLEFAPSSSAPVSSLSWPTHVFEDFELMQPAEMARLKVIQQMQQRMAQQQQQQQAASEDNGRAAAAADVWSDEQRQSLLVEVERMVLREPSTAAVAVAAPPAAS